MPGAAELADGAGSTEVTAQAAAGHNNPVAKAIMTARRMNGLMAQRLRLLGMFVKRGVR